MHSRRNASRSRHSSSSPSAEQRLSSELRAEKLARELDHRKINELHERVSLLEKTLQQERKARLKAEAAARKRIKELEGDVAKRDAMLEDAQRARQASEDFLQGQIRKLENELAKRDAVLDGVNKQLVWFQKNYFDKKSEQHVFEIEEEVAEPEKAPAVPRKRGQQPGSTGHGRVNLSNLAQDEHELTIENCVCGKCGKPYQKLDATENSPVVDLSFLVTLINNRRAKYAPTCKCPGGKIRTAPLPPKLFKRSNNGNSVWLHLIVQKFLHGIPTNRTLKDLSLKGFQLAAGTVTDGFKRIEPMLDGLYMRIKERCQGGEYWCGDETSWRVFESAGQKWWLWLVASDDAVVYMLDPSRSKTVPSDFFAGSTGTLMTDRLASYKGLHEGISKAWCWVHVRRDFLRIFDGIKKLRYWAEGWLRDIAQLFVLAHRRFELWEKGRVASPSWTAAQAALRKQLEEMKANWESEVSRTDLHAEQSKALRSLKRHWNGLTIFLDDPRVPLHNNRAERLLRNSVILRKNSFGSGAQWSGNLAAKLFSITQTWLINGLNPEALLLEFLDETARLGHPPPNLDGFLPWRMTMEQKQLFALPPGFKKPG